jgi:ATP-dependent Lon protease
LAAPSRSSCSTKRCLKSKIIGLLTQRDEAKDDPEPQDLYSVGTAAIVLKALRQPDNHIVIVVQGLRRFFCEKSSPPLHSSEPR